MKFTGLTKLEGFLRPHSKKDAAMHRIYRPHVDYLLDLLPHAGRDYDLRLFDQDLFHLIDTRELEEREFTISTMLGDEQRNSDDILSDIHSPGPRTRSELMIITRLQEVEGDPFGPIETSPTGYINRALEFVAWPEVSPLPFYSSVAEHAAKFKSSIFSGRLMIELTELPSTNDDNWDRTSRARLVTSETNIVAEHTDISWAMAIVGASLKALECAPNMVAINVEVKE